jgi:hypothetical protein
MSTQNPIPPDDFDALLSPTAAPADDSLRQAILRRTTRIVRRRRYVRRAMLVAAMLVCYAAGATTMQFWNRSVSGVSPVAASRESPPHAQDVEVAKTPPAAPSPPRQPAPSLSPYERLRRYSDRLLVEQGDIAQATRYYARALDRASPEERAISAEDSWLLMAIKADRLEERTHENRGS